MRERGKAFKRDHRIFTRMPFMHALAVGRSVLVSTFAGWRGSVAFRPARKQPAQPLQLYDIEACPYCRLVRETLSALDLDALIYPCPKRSEEHTSELQSLMSNSYAVFCLKKKN